MSTTIEAGVPPARKRTQASTKHHVVDHRFAVILDALEGEPQKQAISVCGWAAERTDDPAFALVAWAKKQNKGRCRRQRTDRRDHRQSAAREQQDGTREQQGERRRGTAPARLRGGSGGLDPARIRANVARMEG